MELFSLAEWMWIYFFGFFITLLFIKLIYSDRDFNTDIKYLLMVTFLFWLLILPSIIMTGTIYVVGFIAYYIRRILIKK